MCQVLLFLIYCGSGQVQADERGLRWQFKTIDRLETYKSLEISTCPYSRSVAFAEIRVLTNRPLAVATDPFWITFDQASNNLPLGLNKGFKIGALNQGEKPRLR